MKAVATWQPRPGQWLWLAAALVPAATPHLFRLPLWLVGIWLVAVSCRPLFAQQGRPAPGFLFRLLVTVATGAGLLLHFGTVIGRDAGSALLVMMAGLKLLELKQRRDATLLMLLSYLLVGVQFLFSESIGTAVYAATVSVLITGAWIALGTTTGRRPWRDDLALAARMLAQALPIMLVLFVLFPRLPGPLWALPSDARSARTGLSGDMQPGSVSRLVQSNAVAFRADFAGPVPPPAQRYWRGPVFEFTDGRRWWPAADIEPVQPAPDRLPFQPLGQAYRYTVTLEPSGQPWLPALELPVTLPADARRLSTLELKAARNIDVLRRDNYVSYPEVRIARFEAAELRRNLRVPAQLSERVAGLARTWRNSLEDDTAIVAAALAHFNTQPFIYTLEPPLLGDDPVDAFLFETRRGFCEHYAAAFTLLMRAAGIPARVVTGYQGGEINPLGDYLIVRQSDAHAWSEVWLPQQGWVRIDPTAAVAPERIERRIDLGLTRSNDAVRFLFDDDSAVTHLVRRVRFALDAANNGWNQWVLSYGAERQRDLLKQFGLPNADWEEFAWALLIGMGIALGVLAAVLLRTRSSPRDPVCELYEKFRRRIMHCGIPVLPSDGPHDLLIRLETIAPPWIEQARTVTSSYIDLRYKSHTDGETLERLRRAVKAIRCV